MNQSLECRAVHLKWWGDGHRAVREVRTHTSHFLTCDFTHELGSRNCVHDLGHTVRKGCSGIDRRSEGVVNVLGAMVECDEP